MMSANQILLGEVGSCSLARRFGALCWSWLLFFLKDTAPTEIYPLSLHDALPILGVREEPDPRQGGLERLALGQKLLFRPRRSEEHTSELQSLRHLVCRLLLE